jgi:hypothetical protein
MGEQNSLTPIIKSKGRGDNQASLFIVKDCNYNFREDVLN